MAPSTVHQVAEEEESVSAALSPLAPPLSHHANLCEGTLSSTNLSVPPVSGPIGAASTSTLAATAPPTVLAGPPVTRLHLVQMEDMVAWPSIELLHELVFDPKAKLQVDSLRPSAPEHLQHTEQYWAELDRQIVQLALPSHQPALQLPLLSGILEEIKLMLLHLYPESRLLHEELLPQLDVPFLINQIRHGDLDIAVLSATLVKILKANCAPKRDVLVEFMGSLAAGGQWIAMFKVFLELMELMKLDLLKYRLSKNRPKLVAGYFENAKDHIAALLKRGLWDIPNTKRWLLSAAASSCSGPTSPLRASTTDVTLDGYLDLLMSRTPPQIPETFALDRKRILEFRNSFQDICVLGSAILIFHQWVPFPRPQIKAEVKIRLLRTLASQQPRICDIANHILLLVSRARGSLIDTNSRRLLFASIDHVVDPDHRIFQLVQHRIRQTARKILTGLAVGQEEMQGAGLENVRPELMTLLDKVKLLWSVHCKIHGELYDRLMLDLVPRPGKGTDAFV